ncbi:MAG: hypothetical protein FJY85_17560, partial [Deltaproteobacteria bacterium]|nr:hypothetical protein [Deltaproteobacteria bacterium]
RRVMKDLYDSGVATQAMGFFGFPGETEEEAGMTVDFVERNCDRISYYVIGLLMVLPGSRMHETPDKFGVSSISYEGNALMAPQPVWKSQTRISSAAVRRLYHQVSHLEEIFEIGDYPYVGALSTNHSFLYFERGPDILKRLRSRSKSNYLKLHRVLEIPDRRSRGKWLKSLVPSFTLPSVVYSSPFVIDKIATDKEAALGRSNGISGAGADYLVFLGNGPIKIGPEERKLSETIDGRKNLKSILSRLQGIESEKVVPFLLALVSQGLILV